MINSREQLYIKRRSIIISIGLILILFVLLAGCDTSAGEPTELKIYAGNTDLSYVVSKNKWDDITFDHGDNFNSIMATASIEDLQYVKNSETIIIAFEGKAPDSVKLTEHILKNDGMPKFTTETAGKVIDIHYEREKVSFTINPNYVTSFSSNLKDYELGSTIKGYRFVCSWGNNECEYAFILRGDPAMSIN